MIFFLVGQPKTGMSKKKNLGGENTICLLTVKNIPGELKGLRLNRRLFLEDLNNIF